MLMPQQISRTTSPNPEGIFRACLLGQASAKGVCTSPPCKAKTSFSHPSLLCAVCKEGKRTELERTTHQITTLETVTASLQETQHSRLVSLSHPHGFCPLSWCLLYLTEQAIKCKNAFVCICTFSLGGGGKGKSGGKSIQYWNYSKQIKIFHVTHLGRNMPWKANS